MVAVEMQYPDLAAPESVAVVRDTLSIGRYTGPAVVYLAGSEHFFGTRRRTARRGQGQSYIGS